MQVQAGSGTVGNSWYRLMVFACFCTMSQDDQSGQVIKMLLGTVIWPQKSGDCDLSLAQYLGIRHQVGLQNDWQCHQKMIHFKIFKEGV